jgi:hypothetical protein|tara:strand:+ start:522 stop:1619 length:1098 start_codon:yes stop_codon:yes gene_type:complete
LDKTEVLLEKGNVQLGNQFVNMDELNIFVIETELQYLAFVAIKNVSTSKYSIIFTTSNRVYARLCDEGIDCTLISRESRGWFGRLSKIRSNLAFYKEKIIELNSEFSAINLHFPRIDNIYNNIVINYLKHHFQETKINVRLIPDGAINIFSCSLSDSKIEKQKRWINNIGFRLTKGLEYYPYCGDELGADADIVDRIYCFEGIQTGYPKHKLSMINLPISCDGNKKSGNSVLVIGQNFLQLNTASVEYVERVSEAIYGLIRNISSGQADYAPHPRSNFNEFGRGEYGYVENDYLCIEEKIAEGGYEHVISCYSSALINSKIMFGDNIKTYSIGLDCFPFQSSSQREKLINAYKSLGIEVVEVGQQ